MDETRRQQTTKGTPVPAAVIDSCYSCGCRHLDVSWQRYERDGHGRRRNGRKGTRRRPGTSFHIVIAFAFFTLNELQDFERKSALFSLASSEILIVNLWEHQVGLYQGANMGLLKTVFEVNLGLFGKKATDGCVSRLCDYHCA